jgi:hypothetical protein
MVRWWMLVHCGPRLRAGHIPKIMGCVTPQGKNYIDFFLKSEILENKKKIILC